MRDKDSTNRKGSGLFLYNWEGIYKTTKGDCKLILLIIEVLIGIRDPGVKLKRLVANYWNKYHSERNSYIVDIYSLIGDKTVSNSDKCFYLHLASFRDRYNYSIFKDDTLSLDVAKRLVNISLLEDKHLYIIENDYMKFIY